MPETETEQKRYPCRCAVCSYEFHAAKSILMEDWGMNSGHGSCPGCKTFLHLEMSDSGESMRSEKWEKWLARTQELRNDD